MVVDLPPGSGSGPLVTPTLGAWGAKSAPAYSALLNLAYRWFDPGVTRHPVRGGHWLQAQAPERYPALSDTDVVARSSSAPQGPVLVSCRPSRASKRGSMMGAG